MACNEITSNICIDSTKAKCVDYEGPLANSSSIEEGCVNQHQVNEDVYTIIDNIEDSIVTPVGDYCLTYPLTEGKILPKSVMSVHRTEICDLKTRVQALEDIDYGDLDITGFDLNFQCLSDPCGDPITKLGVLLQLLINKACE